MDFLQSVILGVVEGLTEFLPVSSTAHLILSARILGIPPTEFVKSFEIAIQLGAILAVVWLYGKKFFLSRAALQKIAAAFMPAAILGFLSYRFFRAVLVENIPLIAWTLLLGGVLLIVFELWHKEKPAATEEIAQVSYRRSFFIGVCQAVAIVPGVSRAAATILGGLFSGLSRKAAVEFSFLLAAPTMLAATGYDLLKVGIGFSPDQFGVLAVGFLVSFLVAMLAIKFLLRYIQSNSFIWFGVYRILVGLALICFI